MYPVKWVIEQSHGLQLGLIRFQCFRLLLVVLILLQTSCSNFAFEFLKSFAVFTGMIDEKELQIGTGNVEREQETIQITSDAPSLDLLVKSSDSPGDSSPSRAQNVPESRPESRSCVSNDKEKYFIICIAIESSLLIIFIILYCCKVNEKNRKPLTVRETRKFDLNCNFE